MNKKPHFSILKMKYIIIACGILIPLTAQNRFPLEIGNTWQYMSKTVRNGEPYYVYGWTEWVDRDTTMPNGKTYSVIKKDKGGNTMMRQESSRVLSFFTVDSDQVMYDFSKTKGDTVAFYSSPTDTLYCTITTDDFVTIYTQLKRRQWYENKYIHKTEPKYFELIEGFGIRSAILGPFPPYALTGAIINGVQYGIITSVKSTNDNIHPLLMSLRQNFPNPFNSSTSIQFAVPEPQFISLKIVNVIGQEIAVLTEGTYAAGEHIIHWDASEVTSGIYFYTIMTRFSSQTKKMLMVK